MMHVLRMPIAIQSAEQDRTIVRPGQTIKDIISSDLGSRTRHLNVGPRWKEKCYV